jgi:hypothetical protein
VVADGFKVKVPTEDEDAVTLAGGMRVFRTFEATASGPSLPCDVRIKASIKGGTYVVDEVRATRKRGGQPVTTELLRKIPVGQILRRAVELVVTKGQSPAEREDSLRPRNLEGDDLLAYAAESYRFGVLLGVSPTQHVAEGLGLSRAAAGRWISRAREEGYLGPALGTKAGEAGG